MGSRIKHIQEYLQDNALDAFLVMTKINRQYVSGFTGSAGVVVITPSPHGVRGATLFVDDRYLIRARRESGLQVNSLSSLPIYRPINGRTTRIGVEDRITLREFKWLKKTLKARFASTKDVVEKMRAVKVAEEIKHIIKAQRINDEIFKHIIRLLKKNAPSLPLFNQRGGREEFTEAAVALEMERYAKKLGADGMAFDSIVAFGANAAAPHHLSSNKKIAPNNFLLLDFGVMVEGYHSDFTRTLFIGKPDKKQETVYNTVLEAQVRGIREIGEIGTEAALVDAAARGHIERAGFGKYFTHNTGHGVGLEIHELPNFSPKSEDVLERNMIVTIEPGIYIEKWGGVRIEDMVLVGEKGPVVLSKTAKDLRSMIIKF